MRSNSIGIDLLGASEWIASQAPDVGISVAKGPMPSTVVRPSQQGERPIGGIEAQSIVDGRGWSGLGPRAAQFGQDGCRIPVLDLMQSVMTEVEDEDSSPDYHLTPEDAADYLAAHLRALNPNPVSRLAIVVPDTLSDLSQQRLLNALTKYAFSEAILLWRPIAGVLGWADRLDESEVEAFKNKTVV